MAVFRVRTLQRITCVEKENKPSSLMAIMKEERKEEKLKSRGKKVASAKTLSEYNTVKDGPCNR